MRKIATGNVNKSSGNFFDKYMYYTYIWKRGDQTMLISSTEGTIITFDEKGSAEEHINISCNTKEIVQWEYNMYERQNRQDNIISFINSSFSYENGYKRNDFSGFSIYAKMKGE